MEMEYLLTFSPTFMCTKPFKHQKPLQKLASSNRPGPEKKQAKTDPKLHFFSHQKPVRSGVIIVVPHKWAKINGFPWGYNPIYRVY